MKGSGPNGEKAHQASCHWAMAGFAETGIESQLLLSSTIGETLQALLQIGVVLGKTSPRRNRNHHSAQVSALEDSRSGARWQSVEIQQTGPTSITQHAPKLPKARSWVGKIS